jgi:acylphosphatase
MKRATLIANGKVQKVGYRDLSQDTARELGILGYVENLEDSAVKVVCEGDGAKLENFISRINVQKDFIAVQELSVNYEAPTGEFAQFRIKYGDMPEDLGDRVSIALLYLATTNQKLDAGFSLVAGKIDAGREENKQRFSFAGGEAGPDAREIGSDAGEARYYYRSDRKSLRGDRSRYRGDCY